MRSGETDPSPTGTSFYTLLANANKIWDKCCIRFSARPPIYLDNDSFRILTGAEADDSSSSGIRSQVMLSDCIEVFVIERFDPEDTFGGGATYSSGTAAAQIVTSDSQLPLNQNHLAHELGHVLGLGHPGSTGASGNLIPGCEGSVMEGTGFYADNPVYQCLANCRNIGNALLEIDYTDYKLCRHFRHDVIHSGS